MVEAKTVTRRIIYDEPSDTDAFTGGGHARTANALAKLIGTFDAETRAIGLEGRWGSGKSSIVAMAKTILEADKLEQGKKHRRVYHIFTYDLWAHQTGSFRRTFLEQLIAWLEMQPKSDRAYLQNIYDQITNRTIKTKTHNTKTFSLFGLFVLIFVISLPLIYMWLSPLAFANPRVAALGLSIPAISAVVAMAALSVFQISATWLKGSRGLGNPIQLVRRWRNGQQMPRTNQRLSFLEAISRTIAPFSKDAEITNIEQRVREIDPSQHEFEETFKDIISKYQTRERRIIIVFDNVDRLPADRIKEAWSDVRAMVSADRPGDSLERKFTLIIPYDREHILKAIGSNGDDDPIQEDLLRKSFDAILFVAPPVIADASTFFELKLGEALDKQLDKDTGYRVYKIFDLSCRGELPTPRQIIAFINAVAGLWEQWEGQIALPTIALFMTHRDKLARDPRLLRRPEEIDERQRDLADDPELFEHLAALAYNVEPDYAIQVLLHGPMEELFTGSRPEAEVNEITKSPGWDTILPDIYRDNAHLWAEKSAAQFRNAVRNLAILDASPPKKLECKRALLGAVSKLAPLSATLWENQEDLVRLYELCDRAEGRALTIELAEWLQRSLPEVEKRSFDQGREWVVFIGKMHQMLVSRYGEGDALEIVAAVSFPAGDEFLVGAAYDADQRNFHLKHFANVPRSEELTAVMESKLIESPDRFYYAWPEVRHLFNKEQPEIFAERLGDYLRENKVDDLDDLSFLLKSYSRLVSDSTMTGSLKKSGQNLVSNGALYHHFEVIRRSEFEGADEVIATVIWIILNRTDGQAPATADFQSHPFGNLNATRDWVHAAITDGDVEESIVTRVAELVRRHRKLSEWIDWAAVAPEETTLLQNVIVEVVQGGKYVAPAPALLAKNYEFLKELLADDLEPLLALAGARREPEEWSALDPETLPLPLIEDNAQRQEQGWKALYAEIDQWLGSQDADALKQSLFGETHLILVLCQRVQDAGLTLAPEKLKAAITDHILAILAGDQQSTRDFDAVWNAVPPNSRTGLAADILDHLERTVVTSGGMSAALACYPALMAQLPLSNRPDVAARKVVLRLVESALNGSNLAFAFLDANQSLIQQVIKKIENNGIVGEFRDYLEAESSDDDEEAYKVRQAIFGLIGISPPAPKLDKTDADQQAQDDAAE